MLDELLSRFRTEGLRSPGDHEFIMDEIGGDLVPLAFDPQRKVLAACNPAQGLAALKGAKSRHKSL